MPNAQSGSVSIVAAAEVVLAEGEDLRLQLGLLHAHALFGLRHHRPQACDLRLARLRGALEAGHRFQRHALHEQRRHRLHLAATAQQRGQRGLQRGQVVHRLLVFALGLVAGHGGLQALRAGGEALAFQLLCVGQVAVEAIAHVAAHVHRLLGQALAEIGLGQLHGQRLALCFALGAGLFVGGAGGTLRGRNHAAGVQRQHRSHHRAGTPVAFGERQRRVDAKGLGHRCQRTQWQGEGLLELQAAHFAGDLRQAQQAGRVLQVLLVAHGGVGGGQRIGDLLQALPCLFPVQCRCIGGGLRGGSEWQAGCQRQRGLRAVHPCTSADHAHAVPVVKKCANGSACSVKPGSAIIGLSSTKGAAGRSAQRLGDVLQRA
jgi:hypothetical protein